MLSCCHARVYAWTLPSSRTFTFMRDLTKSANLRSTFRVRRWLWASRPELLYTHLPRHLPCLLTELLEPRGASWRYRALVRRRSTTAPGARANGDRWSPTSSGFCGHTRAVVVAAASRSGGRRTRGRNPRLAQRRWPGACAGARATARGSRANQTRMALGTAVLVDRDRLIVKRAFGCAIAEDCGFHRRSARRSVNAPWVKWLR